MARPFGLGPKTLNLEFEIVGSGHVVVTCDQSNSESECPSVC